MKLRKFRKKKGSTFIIVVFVTAIIFTTATTMIAVVTNDYKMRINESNKVENLYEADSGLDAVYSVISKDCDAAALYATNKVKQESLDRYVNPATYTDDHINSVYQTYFYQFLSGAVTTSTRLGEIQKDDAIYDNDSYPIIHSILNLEYKNKLAGATTSQQLATLNNYEFIPQQQPDNNVELGANSGRTIKITSIDYNQTTNKITIGLSSTFKTDVTKGTGYSNTKTVETKYTINPPKYNNPVERGTQATMVPAYTVLKALVADGNLNINGTGHVTVDGDIWARGKNLVYGADPNYAYDKYQNGIILNNTNLDVTGNVSTYRTFNLQNHANANVTSGLYAQNAYVGPLTNGAASSNNTLNTDSLVTNNDLTMNSSNSNITLNNYYGISDKDDRTNAATNPAQAARESSSIIVNTTDTTNRINVNSAYVNGLAYIAAYNSDNQPYQTGESISVKGNYVAYTTKLPGSTDDVQIVDYDPLWLLDFKGTTTANGAVTAAQQKEDQFVNYFNQTKDGKNGGVNIADIHASGAYIKDGKPYSRTLSNEDEGVVTNEQNDYTDMVFKMGGEPSSIATYSHDVSPDNTTNMITVGHQNPQINFNSITSNFIESRSPLDNYGKFILAKQSLKTHQNTDGITISGTNVTYDGQTYNLDNGEGTNTIDAVIITDEDITISGNVNFRGSIITSGSVNITGDNTNTVNIAYDGVLVQEILAQYQGSWAENGRYSNIYTTINGTPTVTATGTATATATVTYTNKLFTGEPLSTTVASSTVKTKDYVTLSSDSELYDSSKYLKKGLWKLLKETGEVIDQK